MEFFTEEDPLFQALLVFAAFAGNYLLLSGGAFLLFYVLFGKYMRRFRIQRIPPAPRKVRTEIFYSLATFAVFSAMALAGVWMHGKGWTRVYVDISDYPAWWLVLSVFFLLFVHDTWFYWQHRLLHHKKLFPYIHRIHHLSTNPTPWAAFSFHPAEAFIKNVVILLVVLVVPLNVWAICAFLFLMGLMNVIGHLGYELLPSGFTKRIVGRWSNTSTHHNMHHRLVNCNYGLYFNTWDRLMGTNHAKYHEHFEEVVRARRSEHEPVERHPEHVFEEK